MVVFSNVKGALSEDFVTKFPPHFNFLEMLESVCEETGTRIVNHGNNNFEIMGDWSQMTFVHGMLENTLAIYGAVAMVSSTYTPNKDMKMSHNKRMMTPDLNINESVPRDGHNVLRDHSDMRDRPYTPGNTADRYFDSRVGPYTGNSNERYFDTWSGPYTSGNIVNRNYDTRSWPYLYPPGNMAERHPDPRTGPYMPPSTGEKYFDTRVSGPYTPGYANDRHFDPRGGPYVQGSMAERHFDNRDRAYTPGNMVDRHFETNMGQQPSHMIDKVTSSLGDSLGLSAFESVPTPTDNTLTSTDKVGTTNSNQAAIPPQEETTHPGDSLSTKAVTEDSVSTKVVTEDNSQSNLVTQTPTNETPASQEPEEDTDTTTKDNKDNEITVKDENEVLQADKQQSPGTSQETADEEDIEDSALTEEDVKSDHEDSDFNVDSESVHSEEVENFDSEDSVLSNKPKRRRKYGKRRVERAPKRYKKKNAVQGKRKRGRPRKTTGPDENIQCPDCSFIAKDRKSLYAHNRRAHLNVPTACDICGKMYPSLFDMKRHRVLIHNPPKHCCNICGKRYKVNTSLKLHMKSHEPGYVKPVYPCKSCDKSFANPSLLRTHTKRKHEPMSEFEREVQEVKHFCYICHKTFSSKAALQEHTKIIHMKIYDHQCDQCGKVFGYEKSLATHKLIHSSAKNFVCKICGKAFKQKSCMTIHQGIHMEKKFLCGHCGRGFTQRQSLRRHEIIHRGEKPYSCKLCGQAFNSISTIRRHVILVHKLQKDSSVWREDISVDKELLASITT